MRQANSPDDSGRRAGTAALALAAVGLLAAAGEDGPPARYTPTERMAPAHLKAAQDDAARIQASRQAVPPWPGLQDFRAILHAHAEDSAHTGGTRAEMLADARRAGVNAILLTDHLRPPRDFITASWRGLHDGVLFLPGSEDRGFLLYPTHSVMERMKDPTPKFIEAICADDGLIFLSHVEERPDHPMTGLTGMEIYNRHADAKNDPAGLRALAARMTDPASLHEVEESLRQYPDALFAAQVEYPAVYLAKWDAETQARRLTGVAANDCHHNQVWLVKMVDSETVKIGTNVDADDRMRPLNASQFPGIRALANGHRAGDVLARLDFDPYARSFRNVSTHILMPRLGEDELRAALRAGHAYVSHDWMCDPTGFRFELVRGEREDATAPVLMGDEANVAPGSRLVVRAPAACRIRLLDRGRPVAEARASRLEHAVTAPGVYRAECWLTLDGEERGWIYANPIYVR